MFHFDDYDNEEKEEEEEQNAQTTFRMRSCFQEWARNAGQLGQESASWAT